MNATSQTLHNFDATHGSRNVKALHSRSIRSTATHPREKGSEGLRTCLTSLLVYVTVAVTACSSSGAQQAGTRSVAPKVDLCADKLPPVRAGPTNGKLVGTINRGRILIGIEAAEVG